MKKMIFMKIGRPVVAVGLLLLILFLLGVVVPIAYGLGERWKRLNGMVVRLKQHAYALFH